MEGVSEIPYKNMSLRESEGDRERKRERKERAYMYLYITIKFVCAYE